MSTLLDKIYEAGRNVAAVNGGNNGKVLGLLYGIDATQLSNVLESLQQPFLCFIPIQSESLVMRRTVDIGTTMLISQTNQTKEYVTDNSAPRPRTWSGTGYITALNPVVENALVIKPTLLVQQSILEAAADSRQPVKFKTDTGEVVDVLIQDLQISATPKAMNARAISYTVQEVKVLENSILLGAEDLTPAAAKSIPVRAITNLGKGTAVGAGVTDAIAGLLSLRI